MQTTYKGSSSTAARVQAQIRARFGDIAAANYNPKVNCMTVARWYSYGYKVRKGEKSLKSLTYYTMEEIDKKTKKPTGKMVTVPRSINLFFITQVEKRS